MYEQMNLFTDELIPVESDSPVRDKSSVSGKGRRKLVYPIKKHEQIVAMGEWLEKNCDPKYRLAFQVGINVGLRINELLSLRWRDVTNPDLSYKISDDLQVYDGINVYQSKQHKEREIYLTPACIEAFDWYRRVTGYRINRNDFIFPHTKNIRSRPMDESAFSKKLKLAAKAADVTQNIATHSLRKTFGYRLREEGADIALISNVLGHSNTAVTMRYIGITGEEIKKAYKTVSTSTFR